MVNQKILLTGATGQLGALVLKALMEKVDPENIVALARTAEKASEILAMGVEVRIADYAKPETLSTALAGIDKVLLISSSEIGQRAQQHKNVIHAAQHAGVSLIAYTSLLHADSSPLALAQEHLQTETYLQESGVPFVLLRNGWYNENYLASAAPALAHGAFAGSAGEGKISSAARADYAQAAAVVLSSQQTQAGKVYELAGDHSYTLTELAALISQHAGKDIPYVNLPETEFKAALMGAGLPEAFASLLADSDVGVSKGGLFEDKGELSKLIGRPTTSVQSMLPAFLG